MLHGEFRILPGLRKFKKPFFLKNMMTTLILLIILVLLMIMEGSMLVIYPKKIKKIALQIFKNEKTIRGIGYIELIIAFAILFLISL